jgi:DNA polymerase III subunit beta
MKLSTKREVLFGQLQTVTRAASTRSAVQALSGV